MSNGPPPADPDLLQSGIYYRSGEAPGPFFRLLLLNIDTGITSEAARAALQVVWEMLAALRGGVVGDLQKTRPGDPDVAVAAGALTVLLGYGPRFFESAFHAPALTTRRRPRALHRLPPPPTRPDRPTPFKKLHWDGGISENLGEADLALQLIGDSELSVNRAIVEVKKLIRRRSLPFSLVSFFAGFHRDDGRSWIDFHDGVNTMRADERRVAMRVETSIDTPWLTGGTYLSFLKIAVDLDGWGALRREQQEVLVGRDKLTGCPIVRVTRDAEERLVPEVIPQCPAFSGPTPPTLPPEYLNPGRPSEAITQAAHIYRSNLNRGGPEQPANNRLYRQGYEFLDPLPRGIRAGLNFVSFQRDTAFVENILTIDRWCGEVNFGGRTMPTGSEPTAFELMFLIAGGHYAVPPAGAPFPGASLFDVPPVPAVPPGGEEAALEAAVAEGADDGPSIISSFDAKSGRTTVTIDPPMLVAGHGDAGLWLGAQFSFAGQEQTPPRFVSLVFTSQSPQPVFEAAGTRSVVLVGDGVVAGLGDFDVFDPPRQTQGIWLEQGWLSIPNATFAALATVRQIEMRVGLTSFRLRPEQAHALRDLARMLAS